MTMHFSRFQDVYFVEGYPGSTTIIGPVDVKIDGVFVAAQLCDLDHVKQIMAARVKQARGNAVVNFTYGQRSVGFWRSILSADDVSWYGKGQIARINPSDL